MQQFYNMEATYVNTVLRDAGDDSVAVLATSGGRAAILTSRFDFSIGLPIIVL